MRSSAVGALARRSSRRFRSRSSRSSPHSSVAVVRGCGAADDDAAEQPGIESRQRSGNHGREGGAPVPSRLLDGLRRADNTRTSTPAHRARHHRQSRDIASGRQHSQRCRVRIHTQGGAGGAGRWLRPTHACAPLLWARPCCHWSPRRVHHRLRPGSLGQPRLSPVVSIRLPAPSWSEQTSTSRAASRVSIGERSVRHDPKPAAGSRRRPSRRRSPRWRGSDRNVLCTPTA
jgi:hypothetical protein